MLADLCNQIRSDFDFNSMRAGRLIHRSRPGFLHYTVALSDSTAISWGPEYEPSVHGLGVFSIQPLTRDYVDVVNILYRKRSEIFADLLASPHAFHRQWDYCTRGWNCEHWARLIVSGVPRSYQCRQAWGGCAVITGGHFQNSHAVARLAEFRAPIHETNTPNQIR
jgi:hypothetical protein